MKRGWWKVDIFHRVIPGKKMPGRMGHEWNTVQHLPVLKVDDENGLILVKGWLCSFLKIEYMY
jgi:ribosomal protein L3